jgi:Ca2+/Na+ antiporter
MKNLHFNDYLIILIVALMFSCCFFAYKWTSLKNDISNQQNNESALKDELNTRVAYYQTLIEMQGKRLNYFKSIAEDKTNEKKIIIKYKTIYEKINSLPDFLQYGYTDSLLAGCRLKPFKRD